MGEPESRNSRQVTGSDYEQERRIAGWVQEVRALGGISFLILRDRYGTMQVAAPKKKVKTEVFDAMNSISRESVVEIVGQIKESAQAKNGWEIIPTAFKILSESESPLPMGVVDKVNVEADTRFNHRYIDLRRPEVRAVFEIKSQIVSAIGEYLRENGFIEIFTPKIVASGAEGGATLFPIRYFEGNAYLAQSPQLYKQILMSTGMDRVFEISPAFRAEPSDTIRHVSEFISFDGEMAFIDSQRDVMDTIEGCMATILSRVRERCGPELELLGTEIHIPESTFPVVTYSEAVDILSSEGKEIEEMGDIDTEGEKMLGDLMLEKGHELYWIVEYPEESKPFYIMEKEGTPFSYSFDLDYRGQEISSGGQREHRYDHLVERMEEKDLNPGDFEFYLNSFAYGMPPHGGWGIGLERVVQNMLGLPNIREAILFPRDRNRLVP
jgi:aspartyl-tRNA synthetase